MAEQVTWKEGHLPSVCILPEAKAKPKPEKKASGKKSKAKGKIVGVKDLEKEFGISGKVIRRHLRKMAENTKPRGPEPYQWLDTDPKFKKIRDNLKGIVKRKVTLHGK